MEQKEVKFSLVFRDMWQSAGKYVPRVDQLVKVAPAIIEMGCFARVETNGGGFEQVNLLFGENPNRAVREWTKPFHEAGIQTHMLDRALNGLRMSPVPADVRKLFYKVKKAQGTDITRTFCGLNDVRNIIPSIGYAHDAGMISQCCLCITYSPIHTVEYYLDMAKKLIDAGCDEICIKDMAALLTPTRTESLVKAIKAAVPELPLQLHTHYTSGLASMCLLKGVEAGADGIDTAISPLALGTSHAPTESMVAALSGTEFDTGLDLKQFSDIRAYFMTLREKYIKSGLLDPKMLATDANALIYQVPGGMLSNLLSQLKQAGKEDKLDEVLAEVPRVRKDSGYPPLVTPTSQIVGTQAVFNVITGKRYSMCTNEFKGLVAGEYGTTPMPIDPEFQKKIIGDKKIIKGRPADQLEPELDKLRGEIEQWIEQPEDVLSYAQFPKVALDFFEKRRNAKVGINGDKLDKKNMVHPV